MLDAVSASSGALPLAPPHALRSIAMHRPQWLSSVVLAHRGISNSTIANNVLTYIKVDKHLSEAAVIEAELGLLPVN